MTVERLAQQLCYGRVAIRPEDIHPGRWVAMIGQARKYIKSGDF